MNVPNIITVTRIALVPVFLVCMGAEWRVAALVVFAVAGLSDKLDGYLARKMGQITDFGKIMDPLADKLLVLAALVCFVREGSVAVWVVVTVLARELIISTLRTMAASTGTVLGADFSGKVKTAVQIFCVCAILTPWYMAELWPSFTISALAAWIIAAVTVWSGVDYLARHRALFINMK
ncbi:MAG: CDP-diacylglycerol--glycerol-3-phosphate 3-phosphatidyltransferase [Oscillospiraceae bacterium]|nr:CDP-diacylglycerol--glycerol-3-phosphate 3-phosphatidyltransferase [Oscillospiraceae bacterium]